MPPPGILFPFENLDVPVHPAEAAGTTGRSGVGIKSCGKFEHAQGADPNLMHPNSIHPNPMHLSLMHPSPMPLIQVQDQRVDPGVIALKAHAQSSG